MAQLLVRDLEPAVVERLKERARRHHRSLEAEARLILTSAAPDGRAFANAVRFAAEMRLKTAGKISGDSADLIREDRDR
jgi:plasmid stability protein